MSHSKKESGNRRPLPNRADRRQFHRSTHASVMMEKVDNAWVPLLSTSIAFATVELAVPTVRLATAHLDEYTVPR
jgi:hypothetical protein